MSSAKFTFELENHSVSQDSYASTVALKLRNLAQANNPQDKIVILILCPLLGDVESPESPIFVFPLSALEQALEVTSQWANEFQSVNLLLPALTMLFTLNCLDIHEFESLTQNPSDYGLEAEFIVNKIAIQQKKEEEKEQQAFV